MDVKRLEFADFDWPGNRLSVVQAKTGHRDGRPVCDRPQVFLRHTAPIGPFSDQDRLQPSGPMR